MMKGNEDEDEEDGGRGEEEDRTPQITESQHHSVVPGTEDLKKIHQGVPSIIQSVCSPSPFDLSEFSSSKDKKLYSYTRPLLINTFPIMSLFISFRCCCVKGSDTYVWNWVQL